MTEVLTIENAEKSFGKTRALDGAGLELARGEWLAVLGPNGAGKTTLVRAIAGRVRLDTGEIRLLGARLDDGGQELARAARKRLGMIPQEVALYPLMNARENLTVFGELLGLAGSELEERRRWALDWSGLSGRADEPIKGFSGGMKRRLNIACGVLHQPEVVLLDEPTVGVDPQSRERIWEMLEQLRQQGASLLLTTHQLDEAQQVCDRIVIIDHGRDVAAGSFEQLVQETVGPQRRITVTFDGERPALSTAADGSSTEEEAPENALVTYVDEVASELPALLARLESALRSVPGGRQIVDVQIDAPSLQEVFIHLTGRELRE